MLEKKIKWVNEMDECIQGSKQWKRFKKWCINLDGFPNLLIHLAAKATTKKTWHTKWYTKWHSKWYRHMKEQFIIISRNYIRVVSGIFKEKLEGALAK